MEVISDINELREITLSKKTAWMLLTEKNHTNGINDNYISSLDMLKKDNDIVIADLFDFLLLYTTWYQPEKIRPTPMIGSNWNETVEMYKDYLEGHADYVFLQDHDLQVKNFVTDIKDLQKYHEFITSYSQAFDVQYNANYLVLKTTIMRFLLLKQYHGIDIDNSINMWKCGYRAFIYKDFCKKHLNIHMDIVAPLRGPSGVILPDSDPNALQQTILAAVNNKLINVTDFSMDNLKKIFSKNKEVKSIHHFNDPRIFEGDIVEMLLDIDFRKFRLLNYFKPVK